MVSKSAVIGIDLGSAESFVGYVGKGVVDICQNEVSKRATSSLVGFTDRERLLGDAALAQIKSNAKNTCRNFKHLLGQDMSSPHVNSEHFWSTSKIVPAKDGHPGYDVNYKGSPTVFSAVQVAAAYLTKLREVAEKWTGGKVADCVIGVPSYYNDVHRQALLDAARIAGMSVLRLMNEHTATALAYGIYRSNDFDTEKPCTVAFCSMGQSIFSVSIVQFLKGKLEVVCERSDKVGGRDMDECLMREFAAQFKKKVGCDPLSNKKSAFKLEDSVAKTKKILSSNHEAGISCECLMEDEDFASDIKRDTFLEMCKPMMAKVQAVLDASKAASGIAVDQIDFVEVVGGSSRVPWVKEMISAAFGGKMISTTMNADESVARGCALQAAILSPLYKVRDFDIKEGLAIPISVGWMGSAADAEAAVGDDGEVMAGGEGEYKTAIVFPVGSALNTSKVLTFFRKGPFELKAEYADDRQLVPGTAKSLGTYNIELPPQTQSKKVRVKAKLTLSSMFQIESAQMVEEEEYEQTVKEKRELPPSEDTPAEATQTPAEAPQTPAEAPQTPAEAPPPGAAEDSATKAEGEEGQKPESNGDAKKEKKEPEKKYEWVEVTKKKKRTKQTDLPIVPSGKLGIKEPELQQLCDIESAIQADMAEVIETDDRRNDLESHIFTMRDRCSESGEYGEFMPSSVRESFMTDLTKAEDWLYDEPDATKVMYVEKLDELKKSSDPVVWRYKESLTRGEWISAVSGTISNYRSAAENPGEKYGHIAGDKLAKISQECTSVSDWLTKLQAEQANLPKHQTPVLLCADMEKRNMELAKMADEILKEPKPKPQPPSPPAEEKKEGTPADGEKQEPPKPEGSAADVD